MRAFFIYPPSSLLLGHGYSYEEGSNGYYSWCPQCLLKIDTCGTIWRCSSCEPKENVILMYHFTITIADATGLMKAVIFNDVAKTLVAAPCSDLVVKEANMSDTEIPPSLEAIKGKTMAFYIRVNKKTKAVNKKFTVNKLARTAGEAEVDPMTPMPMQSNPANTPLTPTRAF